MDSKSYLLFQWKEQEYGLKADLVEEILLIPQLQPMVDESNHFIGLLNWRSQLVPVVHLDWQFHQPFSLCELTHQLVVIRWQFGHLAIITERVIGIEAIDDELPLNSTINHPTASVVSSSVRRNGRLLLLLDCDHLANHPTTNNNLLSSFNRGYLDSMVVNFDDQRTVELIDGLLLNKYGLDSQLKIPNNVLELYFSKVSPRGREILRKRANDIANIHQEEQSEDGLFIVIFQVKNRYFGLNMKSVREFLPFAPIRSIPGAPAMILGNINWHGEVLTLIDITIPLNLEKSTDLVPTEIIVIQLLDDLIAGIAVDQVVDMIALEEENMVGTYPTIKYGKNVIYHQEKEINIIDIQGIIDQEILLV
jgi:purine-binding chemotaxis protein CheW